MEKIEEQVNPVDRPLFATVLPTVGATPEPAWGGPFAGGLPAAPPNCRIVPAVSTAPELISASAASIFGTGPLSMLKNCESVATVGGTAQLLSISPGCTIGSPAAGAPAVPVSLSARTWLLLRMYRLLPRDTSAPSVPPQHNF